MNLKTKLFLVLSFFTVTMAQAQFNETIAVNNAYYFTEFSTKSSCELFNGMAVTVGGMHQGVSSEAALTVHDPQGQIIGSYTYSPSGSTQIKFSSVIPVDGNIQNPFVNEVLVVGQEYTNSGSAMIVLRIDVITGQVLCAQQIGSGSSLFNNAAAIMSVYQLDGEYIISGTYEDKIYIARINDYCGIIWDSVYENKNIGGQSDYMYPKTIIYDPFQGNYIIGGSYYHTSPSLSSRHLDLFTVTIDEFGFLTSHIKTYDTGTFDSHFDITALQNGNFALVESSFLNARQVAIVVHLDPSLVPIPAGTIAYWDPAKAASQGLGIYENPMGGLDIGLGSNTAIPGFNIGFLQLDPNGTPFNYVEYNIGNFQWMLSMTKSKSSYYLKSFNIASNIESPGYTLIKTDLFGFSGNLSCETYPGIKFKKMNSSLVKILTDQIAAPTNSFTNIIGPNPLPGLSTDCNGSQISFLTAAETPGNISDASSANKNLSALDNKYKILSNTAIYPTLLSKTTEELTITFESLITEDITLLVHNTLGQEIYSQQNLASFGKNVFVINTHHTDIGMNVITVLNSNGEIILSEKIIKQ